MKVDLTIGYDDLSQECKNKIKQLKVMGFNVDLHYPELKKHSGLDTFDYSVHYDGSGLQISPSYTTNLTCNSAAQATTGTQQ